MIDELAETRVKRLHKLADAAARGDPVDLDAAAIIGTAVRTEALLRLAESVERLTQHWHRLARRLDAWSAESGTDELAIWFRNTDKQKSEPD